MTIGTRLISLFVASALLAAGCLARERDVPRMVLIDTDLSLWGDDSNALLLLLDAASLDVRGITTTSGNVWSEEATVATARLLEIAGRTDVPISAGLPASYHDARRAYFTSIERGTTEGTRYAGALAAPPPPSPPGGTAHSAAIDFIIAQAEAHPRAISFIALGPLTNLASALAKAPRVAAAFREVFVFGGAFDAPGNTTPVGEFNFWFDPEAADAVLAAGLPITLLPLDALSNTAIDPRQLQQADSRATAASAHARQIMARRRARDSGGRILLWDEVMAAVAIRPEIVTRSTREAVTVVRTRGTDYGQAKRGLSTSRPPVTVVLEVDAAAVQQEMWRLLGIADGA